ncbi:MAG TPA: dihydropteroate synthase [bacterium]|nr:dihydropteroate synthase [bacterium]
MRVTGSHRGLDRLIPRRDPTRSTRILGILNLTPDSFSDGGRFFDPAAAIRQAKAMVDAGADALDLGAESSRPGAEPVSRDEELRRLLPVLEEVVSLGVPISVDTVKADVAQEALLHGARIINDISSFSDPAMAGVCAAANSGIILMHMRGTPRDMQTRTDYDDVVRESIAFLREARARAISAGIPEEHVLLDPGIGFAKTAEQNLEILRRLREYQSLRQPIVVGASRKSFLSRFGGEAIEDRLPATLAASILAAARGASVLRVHDVAENVRALRAAEALLPELITEETTC